MKIPNQDSYSKATLLANLESVFLQAHNSFSFCVCACQLQDYYSEAARYRVLVLPKGKFSTPMHMAINLLQNSKLLN